MRILMLSWNFPPAVGGIEQVAEKLARGLSAAGHETRVLTRYAPGAPDRSDVTRSTRPGLAGFLVFALVRGYRLLSRWRPDLLLCPSLVSAVPAYLLGLRFRLPWVVLVHGSDLLYPGPVYRAAARFLLRRATRIAANSASTASLLGSFGVPPRRIDVVYPGVDLPLEAQTGESTSRELLERIGKRRVLLFVGRMVRRKGLLEFVEQAMPSILQRCPDALLLLVGDDAEESLVHRERLCGRIEEAVQRLGLGPSVWLLGRRSDDEVRALYRRADLFVMPGIAVAGDVEGFGIVLLEAALAGVPALATRTGGVSEAVVDRETGWLVAPGDMPGLVEATCRLLEDPELRERLGRAGARRAREDFSWPAVTKRYLDLFAVAIGTHDTAGRR